MIDLTDPKGRLLAAALQLASEHPWRDITLLQIAQGANMSLAEFKQQFSGKSELLRYFTRQVDDAVIKSPPQREEGETARDRLFEVIMNRFDAMAPYKTALKSIVRDGAASPKQLRAILKSQYWMLQAAGIATDGLKGQARVAGLTSVYASVFHKWLDDDDEGLAPTMAALDKRLRRGETALARLDDTCAGVNGALSRLESLLRCARPCKSKTSSTGSTDEAASAAAPTGTQSGLDGDPAPSAAGA